MRRTLVPAALALALALGACDFVRLPGDGGPPPETPPEIPAGAPGPPPPDVTDDEFGGPVETSDPQTPEDPSTEGPTDITPDPVDAPQDPVETPPVEVPVDTPVEETAPQPEPEPEPEPVPETPVTPVFSYHPPGALISGTGTGAPDQIVHAPDILFPIKSAPAYLQSQVFNFGGGVAGGDECDTRNYGYPWRDNFCETRSSNRNSPFCPVSRIHQGQDIRVGTGAECNTLRGQQAAARGMHEVIAVEDGIISSIGTYNVKLRGEGRIYNYMHLNMARLAVTAGQAVEAGDLIGYVSKDFGGTPTTFHLHFEIVQNTGGDVWSHVPPYLSLVAAYERRENGPGEQLEQNIAIASEEPWVIPEGMDIIE
jgi:Peptidase family M23